ncbi:hypothetical protein DS830_02900 [Bombilactobacillus bombi]|nr:FtsX-like permease family protein [Bombilactobacillus bombi]AXX64476.1 hypothetical protein DS830_02900 [Bombilactobacillus bombi]
MGIMTTMTANIAERTQEIGIRRSLGASKQDITEQFLLEGIILTLSGGVISIILALIIQRLVSMIKINLIIIYTNNIVAVIIIVLIIGTLFSWIPAKKASKNNILDLIR